MTKVYIFLQIFMILFIYILSPYHINFCWNSELKGDIIRQNAWIVRES